MAALEEGRNGHELRSANDVIKLNILEKKEILQRLHNLEWYKSEQCPIKITKTIKIGGSDFELEQRLCDYLDFRRYTIENKDGQKRIIEDVIDIAVTETGVTGVHIGVKTEGQSGDGVHIGVKTKGQSADDSSRVINNTRTESKLLLPLTYTYKDHDPFDSWKDAEDVKKYSEEVLKEEKQDIKFCLGQLVFDTLEKAEGFKKYLSSRK